MPKSPYTKLFQAVPAYFGGKRKLVPWIFKTLAAHIPRAEWSKLTLVDAFTGGGSVSLFAKAQGFQQIVSNDLSSRSQIIIQGLLVNQQTRLSKADALFLTQPMPPSKSSGWIEQQYGGSVFSSRHAQALDCYAYWLAQIQCPTKHALAQTLLWHLVQGFVCMGTSIGTSNRPYSEVLDGVRDWQTLNPKRFVDDSFPKLLKPVWQELDKKQSTINGGIFTGSPVKAYQVDAIELVRHCPGDILYLDPPYPKTLAYEKANRVLDTVLLGETFEEKPVSGFSQGVEALDNLLDQSKSIPTWVLSYGNAVLSLEELIAKVKQHVPQRTVLGFAQAYTHMPQVSKNTLNQELLVIAY